MAIEDEVLTPPESDPMNPVASEDDTPVDSSINDLFADEDSDGEEIVSAEVPVEDAVEVIPETPVVPETPEPTKADQTPEQPAVQKDPLADVLDAPPQVQQQEQAPAEPFDVAAWKTQMSEALSKSYELSDDDVVLLASEPEKVFPKLAAKLHVEVLEAAVNGIMSQVPGVVARELDRQRMVIQSKNAFFSRWPQLAAHEQAVQKVATMYRQMNPTTPMEQAIEEIGLQASVMLRLPVEGLPGTQVQNPAPVTPGIPPAPAQQAAARTAAPQKTSNAFSQLADEFIQDEEI
jgi:hypothetical protein